MDRPQSPAEDAVLREIVEGVEAQTGEPFFHSLVRHLAGALSVDFAFVSELTEGGTRFRTRSLWGRGQHMPNVEVGIEGTPCEAVLAGEVSHHAENLCERFPRDVALRDWGVVSYCGFPLVGFDRIVTGHFAILDSKPMPDASLAIAVMRIFAARARAELDRLHAEEVLRVSEERLARVLDSAMDAIVTFDEERRIELFNQAAEKVFGCKESDILGAPFDRFLSERLRAVIGDAAEVAGGSSRYLSAPEGLIAVRAGGAEFPIEATLSHTIANGRRLFTLILRDVEELRRAERELHRVSLHKDYLEEEIKSVHNFEEIVGRSPALAQTLDKVALVAPTDSSVLILGETGTGKELIARAVHSASPRKKGPFVKANCAALPAGLIESELFGHERGAFTGATQRRIGRFELADGGTIFLDEIGDMPPDVQVKLLRVLQEREIERVGGQSTIRVNVRVLAATHRDLARAVADGTFRADLYYRLNVFPITVPPLRSRKEDIPLLVEYFASRYSEKLGRKPMRFSAEGMLRLSAYDWPGNVRELENVIERAVILSTGEAAEVPPEVFGVPVTERKVGERTPAPTSPHVTDTTEVMRLVDIEKQHIEAALERAGWRIEGPQGAASSLGINASTLRSRMKKLGIRRAPSVA